MTIGERIREIRERIGMSQVDFAEKINVSKQTLYKYENNIITNIPSDKIENAAKIGNVSPAYLMGWEEEAKIADSMFVTSTSPEIQLVVEVAKDMSVEQLNRLLKYAKYLKYEEEDS